MISVTVIGTTPRQLAELIEIAHINTQKGLEDTALETRTHMIDIIGLGYQGRGKRAGSHGELENAIQAHKLSDDDYGVGDILTMNQTVPYWMLLNNGGMVALKARRVPGYFDSSIRMPIAGLAGTGVGKEEYVYSPRGALAFSFTGVGKSSGKYLMIVKNPIGAVNYIEKTKDWLKTVMGGKFSAWVNKKSVR